MPASEPAKPILILPDQMEWLSVPDTPGASATWLVGAAGKPGPFVVRIHLEEGGQILPHTNPDTLFITVISGELYVGSDTEIDPAEAIRCPTGTFLVIPAKKLYYLWARHSDAVVQEWGTASPPQPKSAPRSGFTSPSHP